VVGRGGQRVTKRQKKLVMRISHGGGKKKKMKKGDTKSRRGPMGCGFSVASNFKVKITNPDTHTGTGRAKIARMGKP